MRALLLVLLGLLLLPGVVAAADMSWATSVGGTWGSAQCWLPPEVPDWREDTATLGLTGPYTVFLDTPTGASRVTISNPQATLQLSTTWMSVPEGLTNHGTIRATDGTQPFLSPLIVNESDGRIRLDANSGITFSGQAVHNNGLILVNADQGSMPAYFNIASDDYDGMILDGTGTLLLQGNGNPDAAAIASPGGSIWIHGPEHTVRGNGTISAPFLSQGRIVIDEPGRVLRLCGGPKTNTGVIEALNGGILRIDGVYVDQDGPGVVRADAARVEILAGGGVWDGFLTATNGGLIELQAGVTSLLDVTIDGDVNILPGAFVFAGRDFWTNNGTVIVNPERSSTDIVIRAMAYHTVTINGSGEMILRTAGDPADARLESTGETMVNGPLHTIRGDGAITCPFVNHGRIEADATGRVLRIVSSPMANDGMLGASAGGVLELVSNIDQTGGGTLFADAGSVQLGGGAQVRYGNLTSTNGGRFTVVSAGAPLYETTNSGLSDVTAGSRLFAGWETLTNNGTITINSDRQAADAGLCGADYCNVTIAGTGEIVLQTAGDPADAYISTYGWYMVNGPAHTIRGEGSIYTTLTNHGVIRADAAGRSLFVPSDLTNDGVAVADAGGLLNVTGPFRNQENGAAMGVAEAKNGGTARFGNVGPNYDGEALHGAAWRVRAGSTMRLMGADVRMIAADVLLEGQNSNLYRDDGTTDALGMLWRVAENGRLEVRDGRALALNGALENKGTLVVGPGGSLTAPGAVVQHGDSLQGLTTVDGDLLAVAGLTIDGGALDGTGSVHGDLVNSGEVRPGHSPGTLSIDGRFQQLGGGTLVIELAGVEPGRFDRLAVAGEASLAGTIVVRSIEGFVPEDGMAFPVLTCGSRVGAFADVRNELGGRWVVQAIYTDSSVTLVLRSASSVEEPGVDGGLVGPSGAPELTVRTSGSGAITLGLRLPEAARVSLTLHDLSGRSVALVCNGTMAAGLHEWVRRDALDGRRLPSGVYFARAVVGTPGGAVVLRGRAALLR